MGLPASELFEVLVRLSPDQMRKVRAIAAREECALDDMVLELVERALNADAVEESRKKAIADYLESLGDAASVSPEDEEAVRQEWAKG